MYTKDDIVLIVSDPHIPWEHPDSLAWYEALYNYYKCTGIACVGDLTDQYGMSRYEKDVVYYGVLSENAAAKKKLKLWGEAFPNMLLVPGNHCWRLIKLLTEIFPLNFEESIDALKQYWHYPKHWTYQEQIILPSVDQYLPCMIEHGLASKATPSADCTTSYSVIYGHHHKSCFLIHNQDGRGMRFRMCIGHSMDAETIATKYAKAGELHKKQIVGCGIWHKGKPILLTMQLDKKGRWNGKL